MSQYDEDAERYGEEYGLHLAGQCDVWCYWCEAIVFEDEFGFCGDGE